MINNDTDSINFSNNVNKQHQNYDYVSRKNSLKNHERNENPLTDRNYSFNSKKKSDGITMTNINSIKYAHMNKSEFKKLKKGTKIGE